jgi:hypothetical protein
MKRYVIVAAAALVVMGCGKKTSESLAEKMIEHAMAKDGVQGKVNISDGKVTMETKDGTTSYAAGAGTKVPDTFPKDVQVYAGAKVLASVSVPNGQNLMLESGDSIEKIIAFYKGQMSAGGWDEKMSMNQGESSVLIYKKEQRQASIVVTRAEKGSQINLTIASDSR